MYVRRLERNTSKADIVVNRHYISSPCRETLLVVLYLSPDCEGAAVEPERDGLHSLSWDADQQRGRVLNRSQDGWYSISLWWKTSCLGLSPVLRSVIMRFVCFLHSTEHAKQTSQSRADCYGQHRWFTAEQMFWPQIHICRTPMWRQGEKKEETQGSDGADRGEQEFMGRVMTLPLVSLKMIIRGSEAYNYRPRWGGGGGGRVKEIDGTCTEDPSSFGLLLKSLSIPWH